ncbi:zonular occludens toxin domain-containing protein [Silvimonas amylolytica]|uniref:Zona occludens toxin N-terminal domain-containing protein n=1 Tax=Silvimonas amylolytica TaxID=449663 RepID=A0ABQ2PGP4_9NEIS|nr:zonular occludens toxin domain-containing protein [Silvimonas amylolytica]GGP24427.1 hypothetical protein GCM10010971_02460 [Silvimonas amylolytica]GGP28336.1 hypothetical protein GCM10010971_41550 [Silvimonas amylolytica]
MADYFVTGKKGSGKSLLAVGRIRDALLAGKKVATNLDIKLDGLLPHSSRVTLIRLPDAPTIRDMEAIGRGQPGIVEEENGLIVLDECAAFLNARSWGDKERQPLLDWFIHSRKLGWDTMFIAQGPAQIDKQVRDTLVEYHVPCKRLDRLSIPVLTHLTGIRPPKVHMGMVKYGMDMHAMVVDRWFYRGRDLYPGYDTAQIFLPASHDKACALHTMLSPWHLAGRYEPVKLQMDRRFLLSLAWRVPLYAYIRVCQKMGSRVRLQY